MCSCAFKTYSQCLQYVLYLDLCLHSDLQFCFVTTHHASAGRPAHCTLRRIPFKPGPINHSLQCADWLAMPQNEKEFLIVFFDDQMDLASWVSKDGLYLLSMLQLWWRLLSTPTLLPMLAPCATACPKKSISDTFPFLSSSRSRTL